MSCLTTLRRHIANDIARIDFRIFVIKNRKYRAPLAILPLLKPHIERIRAFLISDIKLMRPKKTAKGGIRKRVNLKMLIKVIGTTIRPIVANVCKSSCIRRQAKGSKQHNGQHKENLHNTLLRTTNINMLNNNSER
ncbi:hypothetical protein UF64_11125 [Thalassospira sp. HJ]|nr:hypothetical protein UF64_11125 [Thalassospira sp. HJ]